MEPYGELAERYDTQLERYANRSWRSPIHFERYEMPSEPYGNQFEPSAQQFQCCDELFDRSMKQS